MQRVLLVTLEYPPMVGGVANYYQQLVWHVTNDNITVLDNKSGSLTPWWKSFWVIYKNIKVKQINYVLVGQILPLGTVLIILNLLFNTPFAVFIHGMDITVPQKYWRKRVLLKLILNKAKHIITVSNYTKQEIVKLVSNVNQEKIVIISPAPTVTPESISNNRAILPVDLPGCYILSVGRLVERKGFDLVIQALAKLSIKHNNVHYVIAGSGIETYQVNERVHVYSGLSNEQIALLYQQCAFLVMPARRLANGDFEGFGTVVLEAALFGKPCIGGEGGMSAAIIHNKTGVILQPVTVNTLANQLQNWLDNPVLVQQLGVQAQQRAKLITWEDNVNKLESVWQK
ncbi:MAG: glycosyltransferase family 4 protein [Patescibacteria group bacterium]|jgi:phosphatidylinositol alpha-1,6-mannosyltransferase